MLKMMEEKRQETEEKRQIERKEDKEEMKSVAREIKEGVRNEMEEAMKPWQERTLRVEESTAEVGEEVKRLAVELRELKEQLATRDEGRSYAGVTKRSDVNISGGGGILTGANTVPISNGFLLEDQEKERIRDLMCAARRVVGLKPIDKKHVEHTKRRLDEVEGETEEDKEKRAKEDTVMMFMKCELKMKEKDIKELEIKKIFAPAKEDWKTLYVELATWEQAKFLLSFTTFLRRNTTGEDRLEVVKYIPRDLFARFKAVTALGNQARIESDKTINFRVSFGSEDFILQQRPKGSRGWGPPLPLPAGLPAFEHQTHLPRSPRSPGEAPGRPTLTPEQQDKKRSRESTSPSGTTPVSKKTFDQRLEAAALVSSPTISPLRAGQGLLSPGAIRDVGSVTSITTTPASSKTTHVVETRSKTTKEAGKAE